MQGDHRPMMRRKRLDFLINWECPFFSTIAFPNIFRLADGPGWSVNNHQGFCSYQSESHRFWIAPIRGQRGTIFQVNTSNKGKKVAAIEEDQWPDITGSRKVRTIRFVVIH
jgi:hypothetical protein